MGIFRSALAGAAALALGVAATSAARADTIQLGFILDESGSIGSSNYSIIKNGLANAIASLVPLPGVHTYEISVVSFASSAQTVVNRHVVLDNSDRIAIAAAINADSYTGGSTNYAAAFNLMTTILTTGGNLPTLSFVNFATDGDPTLGGTGVAEFNAMIAAGIDNVSVEAIGSGVNSSNLQNNFCYPGPCDTSMPFDFPSRGFYIGVANAEGYAAAIGNKIQVVTQQTPEPASMALLGTGLLGLGFLRRRFRASN